MAQRPRVVPRDRRDTVERGVPNGTTLEESLRMTVSCTITQHEWLRRQAFEQRMSIAAVLRRCIDQARDRTQDERSDTLFLVPGAHDHRPPRVAQQARTAGWIRMSLSFTPEQHEWLWRRAFEERTTVASLVRRYVSDVRVRVLARP
jgi:hypothetical protein